MWASGLEKQYGDFVAVRGIDFAIQAGECFGFLGPNGAGKTSTMRMIQSVSAPSAGRLSIFGLDPTRQGKAIRARLGVCPQENNLDAELTVRQNLEVYASYFGLPAAERRRRAAELLESAGLADRGGSEVRELSGGMKRRLTLVRALVHEPELMILDEPSTALDPQARHVVWQQLRGLKDRGVTMVLTTHSMVEAEQLCDRLVILDRGKILAEGPPDELIREHAGDDMVEIRAPADRDAEILANLDPANLDPANLDPGDGSPRGVEHERAGDLLIFFLHGQTAVGDRLIEICRRAGLSCRLRKASLEDVFLRLTGRELRE